MADRCKYEKYQYQVSYDSGSTWQDVTPIQVRKGDITEYMSLDCSEIETLYRWVDLQGTYICDGDNKYTRQIQEESYDNGETWYASYPTVYRQGSFVGVDEEYCADKFEGHYITVETAHSISCGAGYRWNGVKCVYVDPLKVVKCDGSSILTSADTQYYTSGYTLLSGKIGDCVTSIADYTFQNCFVLEKMDIPSGITSIGTRAFNGCSALTTINIPSGVTNIGYGAFSGCTKLPTENYIRYADTYAVVAVNKSQTSYTLKNNTKWIGDNTFHSCFGLTNINIPNNVTRIGQSAFYNCIRLLSIDMPTNLTSIGNGAFANCSGLTSVTIHSGITSIEANAFYNCRGITSITIEAVTPPTIGGSALLYVDSPIYVPCESVDTYKSAEGWSTYASFITCKLNGIKLSATYSGGQTYSAICDTNTELTSGATQPNGYDYRTMRTVEIGDCITSIARRAFFRFYGLRNCTIGSGTTYIGAEAFYACTGLTSCTFGDSIKNIDTSAFNFCSGLTSIDIPDGITNIGDDAFRNCTALSSVTIGSGDLTIGNRAFRNCTALSTATIGNGVTSIGYGAFLYCTSLTSIEIPNSVTSIGTSAFTECYSLTSCTIGSGVTTIDTCTFYYCRNLKSIVIPNSVTAIGERAFIECSGMTSCTIGSSVTSIGLYGFANCKALQSLTLPNSITTLGARAFAYCTSLSSITVEAVTPPTMEINSGMYGQFYDTNNCPIYVPAASVEAYKAASGWSDYANRIQAIP